MHTLQHFINGRRDSEQPLDSISTRKPSDLKPFAQVPLGRARDIEEAVTAALDAYSEWSSRTVEERAAYVKKMSDWLMNEYGAEGEPTRLKNLIADEVGKPLPEADIEVVESADFLAAFAERGPQVITTQTPSLNKDLWPSKVSEVVYDSYGVVAIIKPWNYPLEMILWSLGPALISGNTVVIKPSEKSSAVGSALAEMMTAANLPPGVVNIVFGDGRTGELLVSNPSVSMVSFTGSVEAGRSVALECAQQLKKCSLELGGNDAAIVCDDCDVTLTANGLAWGAFCNAGQVCVGIKKAYVHSAVYDEIQARTTAIATKLRLGTDIGPLVDQAQFDSVAKLVRDAVDRGASAVPPFRENQEDGLFFHPTVLTDISSDTKLLEHECFGPVLPLIRVQTEKEAIDSANRSKYGLGASVWTQSREKARRIAHALEVGMVWMNDVNIAYAEAPWGGRKSSGLGFELSDAVFHEYCRAKHINYETGTEQTRGYWYPY